MSQAARGAFINNQRKFGTFRDRENDVPAEREEKLPYQDLPGFPAANAPKEFQQPFHFTPYRYFVGKTDHVMLTDALNVKFCIKCGEPETKLIACAGSVKEAEANLLAAQKRLEELQQKLKEEKNCK